MVWARKSLPIILLITVVVSPLAGVTETLLDTVNRYRGQTMRYAYTQGDPDYDQSGLVQETVYEDARGFPVVIELSYSSGTQATATMYDDGRVKTIEYRYPDHTEIEYYDIRQFLSRTEVFRADSLRETRFYDDSLRVTSIVTPLPDGTRITRYYDESGICRLTETLHPDGTRDLRQTDEANQERDETIRPEGRGRVEIRPIPEPTGP